MSLRTAWKNSRGIRTPNSRLWIGLPNTCAGILALARVNIPYSQSTVIPADKVIVLLLKFSNVNRGAEPICANKSLENLYHVVPGLCT